MASVIEATYDGKVFRPDGPVDIEPNTRVRIVIDAVLQNGQEPPSFLSIARNLRVDGPPDWSENLDKYLYGHLYESVDDQEEDGK